MHCIRRMYFEDNYLYFCEKCGISFSKNYESVHGTHAVGMSPADILRDASCSMIEAARDSHNWERHRKETTDYSGYCLDTGIEIMRNFCTEMCCKDCGCRSIHEVLTDQNLAVVAIIHSTYSPTEKCSRMIMRKVLG